MTAIRLARGVTGRDLLVKFAGHYHGHSDGAAGRGRLGRRDPRAARLRRRARARSPPQTLVLPYNDLDAVRAAFAEHGDRIAAVITEAAAANMGVVAAEPGLQRGARRARPRARRAAHPRRGAHRLPRRARRLVGARAACREARTRPTSFTFGKVIGGGMPLAALGGRADVMDCSPRSARSTRRARCRGNPVAVAAGLATLRARRRRRSTRASTRPPRTIARRRVRRARAPRASPTACSGRATCSQLRVRRRRGAARLRRRAGAGGVAVPAVLPRDARRRRLAAAVGVRGVVRLGRARRRGGRPHRRRAARRRARRGIRSPRPEPLGRRSGETGRSG